MQVSNCCNKISPWSPDLLGSNKKSSVHYKLCTYNSVGNYCFGTGFLKPRFLRLEKILGGRTNLPKRLDQLIFSKFY